MRPAAPMRSQSPFDDRAQLAGGLDWTAPARLDDHPRYPSRPALLGSYHVSQQNTQTGRLTAAMFDAMVAAAMRAVTPAGH